MTSKPSARNLSAEGGSAANRRVVKTVEGIPPGERGAVYGNSEEFLASFDEAPAARSSEWWCGWRWGYSAGLIGGVLGTVLAHVI